MLKNDGKLSWLHISDFHFSLKNSFLQDRVLDAFLQSLPTLIKRFGPVDLIFASGDIAAFGKQSEYAHATEFFDKVLKALGLGRERLFVVPGNHDVDRDEGAGLVRTLKSLEEADVTLNPEKAQLHIKLRQAAFKTWFNEYFSDIRSFSENSTISPIEQIKIAGQIINVVLVNTAAFSFDNEDAGKLWIGRRNTEALIGAAKVHLADLTIAVMHHPLSWIAPQELNLIKAGLRSVADIVLHGHFHENESEAIIGNNGHALHLAAGAMYQTSPYPKCAMFVRVAGTTLTYLPVRYEDAPSPVWTVDPSINPDSPSFEGSIDLQVLTDDAVITAAPSPLPIQDVASVMDSAAQNGDARSKIAKVEFEADLFTIGSRYLYVEPRLFNNPKA